MLGNAVFDSRDNTDAERGTNFLDPNFISINNTDLTTRYSWSNLFRRRAVSAFGSATFDYQKYLYVTVTGRNDWTSTIPVERNSFFYPSVNTSFIFTDAFPSLTKFFTSGKLRAGWAEVGRDAPPYSYRTTLESKTTSFGGYGYGFTGPNPPLKPEFAKSYEFGTELSFLDDRLGIDATVYRKQTQDQIVQNLRGSYATGFILFNLNGADDAHDRLGADAQGYAVPQGQLVVGHPGQRDACARHYGVAAEQPAGVVRLRHVAVRQRPQRHPARACPRCR